MLLVSATLAAHLHADCSVCEHNACGASGMQDQDYSFPMDRKIPLPDDVMRTKTFVLHPTSLEHATEQLEQVLLPFCPNWQRSP